MRHAEVFHAQIKELARQMKLARQEGRERDAKAIEETISLMNSHYQRRFFRAGRRR